MAGPGSEDERWEQELRGMAVFEAFVMEQCRMHPSAFPPDHAQLVEVARMVGSKLGLETVGTPSQTPHAWADGFEHWCSKNREWIQGPSREDET